MEENDTSNNSGNGQAPNQNPQAQAATKSDGQAPNDTSTTLDDLQRQIKELRNENASHRRKLKEQEDATKQAEELQLKEQGKYKELAEQHAARVRELEPVNERYSQLSQLVAAQVEAQIKDWPSEVKAFDPGQDAPIEQRLAWIERSQPLIAKLQMQARSNNPGNRPGPAPTSTTPDDIRSNFENKLRATGRYGA